MLIAALPDRPDESAAQCASLRVAIVYVVADEGETDTVRGLVNPLNAVPSDKVPLNGPEPVAVIVRLAALPLQIAAVPLMAAVGCEYTVTTALPARPVVIAEQCASFKVAIV